jgi:methionyl-tRNA formyltransferase
MLAPFLGNDALRRELRVDIPLAVRIRPSMRLADRWRDLRRATARRAQINRIPRWLQLIHYLAYRWVVRGARSEGPESAGEALGAGRRLLDARSINDPAVVAALRGERWALGVVLGADMVSRRTLEAVDLPLFNIHFSDPALVRGLPPVFWEILAGHDSIRLTLHLLTRELDAGPIVAQREVPIAWHPTLGATIARTLDRCPADVALLLADSLPQILNGRAMPRSCVAGTLRTTPSIRQILRAASICRERARASGAGAG